MDKTNKNLTTAIIVTFVLLVIFYKAPLSIPFVSLLLPFIAFFVLIGLIFYKISYSLRIKKQGSNMQTGVSNTSVSIAQNYWVGNLTVYVSSTILILINLLFFSLSRQAKSGQSGTEFIGLALVFPYYLAILTLLGSLLSTAFRHNKLPSSVRKRRLIFTLLGLLSISLPYILS